MTRARDTLLLLVGPYGLVLLLFLAVPLLNLGSLSFFTPSVTEMWVPKLTLQNYQRIADLYYVELALRTLRIGVVTTAVCVLLGYPLSYFLARTGPRIAQLGIFLLIMPLMVSTVIRAFGWMVILGRRGVLNAVLGGIGLPSTTQHLYTETAVVIALVQLMLPFMVLPLLAAIEKIPRALEEAARNLGASTAGMFRKVILPLSLPGLVSGCLLVFIGAISVVVTPSLVGGKNVRMIGNQIYDQVVVAHNWPFASTFCVVLIAVTLATLFLCLTYGRRLSRGGPG